MNWYKIALKKYEQKDSFAYHGTSYDKAQKILTQGFDTYVSQYQFEEYFYQYYNDLSSENQKKIEIPNNLVGAKWESAVDKLSELWYQENPNVQIIWVTDLPEVADDFGNVVLEVDTSLMEYFFSDMSYGWCEKYESSIIPSKYFNLVV